jgi:hypothetical protein
VLQQSSPRSWEDLRQTLERYQAVGKVRHSKEYLAGSEDGGRGVVNKGGVGKDEVDTSGAGETKDNLVETSSTGREDTMAGHMNHEDIVHEDGCTRMAGEDKEVELAAEYVLWALSLAPIV